FAREKVQDPKIQAAQGWIYLRLAKLTEQLGEADQAIALSWQARTIFDELSRQHRGVSEYPEGVARALDALGSHYSELKQPDAARDAFRAAAAIWKDLATHNDPEAARYNFRLATTLNRVARVLCLALQDADECD